MAEEGFLPPIVVEVTARDRAFLETIAKDEAVVDDFGKKEATATLGVNATKVAAGTAEAAAVVDAFGTKRETATLGVNAGPAIAGAAAAAAAIRGISGASAMPAWANAVRGNLGYDFGVQRWRQMSGAQGGQFATDAQLAAMLAGMSPQEKASLPAGAVAAATAAGAAGGKGGGGGGLGLLAAMGFTGGGRFGRFGLGLLAGLPAIGTLGGLAGFSAEGVLGSALGVGGSMIGAGIGAGLLGLGAAGVGAVGMGTDMAGFGQAIGDVQKYRTALNALNTAIATYGKNSTQAATAQAHLNFVLSGMPKAAQGAIVGLSHALTQFKVLFDQATGTAERIGAGILTRVLHVGESLLPTIGAFATENMTIIKNALTSFFAWIKTAGKGGGLGILTHLESVFQQGLPTGVHAFEQGFELLARTITIVSTHLGGFIKKINHFLTRMNGATFHKWAHFVNDMIGLFQAWWPLLRGVGKTFYELFKPAVGLGKQLAHFLTSLLKTFDKFLAKKGTQSILHQLFTAHAGELIKGFGGILRGVLPALEQFLKAFVQIEKAFRGGFTVLLMAVAKAITAITKNHFAATLIGWAGAIALVMRGLGPLSGFFIANPILAGIIALGIGILLLVTHWKQVWGEVKRIAADVWHFLDHAFHNGIVQDILAIWSLGLIPLAEHWKSVWAEIKHVASDAWHFLDGVWHHIDNGLNDVVHWFESLPGRIMRAISHLLGDMEHFGEHLIDSLIHGIESMAGGVIHAIEHLIPGGGVIGSVAHFFGLAEGGLVTHPTLAVVGEAGPELVVPLSKLGGANITGSGVSPLPSSIGRGGGASSLTHSQTNNITIVTPKTGGYQLGNELVWHLGRSVGVVH